MPGIVAFFNIFPHNTAIPITSKRPSRFVSQTCVWMLIVDYVKFHKSTFHVFGCPI